MSQNIGIVSNLFGVSKEDRRRWRRRLVGGSCQDKTLSAMVACFGGNASKFGIESESSPEKRGYRAGKPYPTKKTIDRGPQYRRRSRVGSSSVLFYSQQHTESEESHENNKKEQKIAAAKAYLQIHRITQYALATTSKGPSNLVTI